MRSLTSSGRAWKPSVYRGLHDPVRCLGDVIEAMTANLDAELNDPHTSPQRREEIKQRLVLLENIAV